MKQNEQNYESTLDMIKKYPNDYDLGMEYRQHCIKQGGLDERCLQYPNNLDLGYYIRKTFNNG
jgi:hypothetical protein